jgi:esterase/lipase
MIVKTMHRKLMKIVEPAKIKQACYLCLLTVYSFVMPASAQNSVQDASLPKTYAGKVSAEQEKINTRLQHQVKFKARAEHDFLLTADYRFLPNKASAKDMPGVIVLHGCHSDRTKYKTLSNSIAEQGLHTLSLDFRGYGNSVDQGYSELAVKKNATDIMSYQAEVAVLMSYWSEDLLAAYKFLRNKIGNSQGISVVASGCAGAYAIALAENMHISSMVLLTPEMSYADKERYKNLVDIPSYFISSAHHTMSYATAQELFTWNGSKHSKHQVYKGDKLNYQIIKANKYLVNDIALWLKFTLR